MNDDLEILQKTFDRLQDDLVGLNQEVALALAGVKNKGEATIDVERWHDRKKKIEVQIPIIQSKLLQTEIRKLTDDRLAAKAELDAMLPSLELAAADYDEKLRALQESFARHGRLSARAFTLDQTVVQTWEEVQEKKRQLRNLIQEVTGIDEQANTDNLLIRN